MCDSTRSVLSQANISPESVAGISISAQMMGITLIDKDGVPIRPSINYLESNWSTDTLRCEC
jgi:sugar (pentulose or hexulose) kinase